VAAIWQHVEEAIDKVGKEVKLPVGYHTEWPANTRAEALFETPEHRPADHLMMIFMILYTMFNSFKWAGCCRQRRYGAAGRVARSGSRTHFSVSSGVASLRCSRLGADRRHHGGVHQPTPLRGTPLRIRRLMAPSPVRRS